MMKAIVVEKFGDPEVLKAKEIPTPKAGPNEVLIRMRASGLNPVDTYIRSGMFEHNPRYGKLPYTPGIDGAGIVEAIGDEVTKVRPGDGVFTFSPIGQGTLAQYTVCKETDVWPLPSHISFQQGASIGVPYFTAYRALFQKYKSMTIGPQTVLIHGASGGVGLAAVQLAKAAGMIVFGTAGSEAGLQLVKECGADRVFNHKRADYVEEIMKAIDGFDLILETNADINLAKDLSMAKTDGLIAIVGSRGSLEIDPSRLFSREIRMVGVSVLTMNEEDTREAGSALVRGLIEGRLNPIVDKAYAMEEVSRAHRDIIQSAGAKGKLVINIP